MAASGQCPVYWTRYCPTKPRWNEVDARYYLKTMMTGAVIDSNNLGASPGDYSCSARIDRRNLLGIF